MQYGSASGRAAVAPAALELAFQEQYGVLQRHLWFGDGCIMVGFRSGHIVVVSTAR
jgi:WD repeat-containing protein 19